MLAFGIVVLCLLGIMVVVDVIFMGAILTEPMGGEETFGFFICLAILLALATSIVYVSLTLGGT